MANKITMESAMASFDKAIDFVFNNQDILLSAFNQMLDSDKELKKQFFSMSKEEQDKNFKFIANMAIGELAIKIMQD